jgi:cysteine-rich repeat protein
MSASARILLLWSLVAACGPEAGSSMSADGGPELDAPRPDAGSMSADGGAAVDASGPPVDAATDAPESTPDAGEPDSGSYDGGPDNACGPAAACRRSIVVEGVCSEAPLEDGTSCGDGQVCTLGECVERTGCGDGYREPGPAPPREACDDGNLEAGDSCDASCTPTWFSLAAPREVLDEASLVSQSARALSVDDGGNVLVVAVSHTERATWLWAARLDARLAPLGEPVVLAREATGFDPQPAAVGLADGWLIASATAHDGDLGGVELRELSASGELAPARWLHESRLGQQHGPRLARSRGGFMVVWIETATEALGNAGRVLSVRGDARGRLVGAETELVRSADPITQVALHGSADGFLLGMVSLRRDDAGRPRAEALALTSAGTPAGMLVPVSAADGYALKIAAHGDGRLAFAYASRRVDADGDVIARGFSPATGVFADERLVEHQLGESELPSAMAPFGADGVILLVEHGVGPSSRPRRVSHDILAPAVPDETRRLLQQLEAEPIWSGTALAALRGGTLVAVAPEWPATQDRPPTAGTDAEVRLALLPADFAGF